MLEKSTAENHLHSAECGQHTEKLITETDFFFLNTSQWHPNVTLEKSTAEIHKHSAKCGQDVDNFNDINQIF